nr:SusC/RagA family TonB-linked outer membrane protein [Bacteroides sp. 214]
MKKTILALVWLIAMLAPAIAYAQTAVGGNVTDMKGEPIGGVSIVERGANNRVFTNANGDFVIDLNADSELLITATGYRTQLIPVNGRTQIPIRMEVEALMETAIVTAMGITKKEASIAYSTQLIQNEEFTRVKDPNFITALAGKSAGVRINRSFSGLGGSAKINIRGTRSINSSNQPLFVIDGVPILTSINEGVSTVIGGISNAANRDGTDGISNLNPDDIESLSLLKGASAAALYGTQAANGVIVITTKKGEQNRQLTTFSSTTMVDYSTSLPEFQNHYGMDDNRMSWGSAGKLQQYNNEKDFFRKGVTSINSLSISKGTKEAQTYFSYANTYGRGVVDKNNLKKHNLMFRETTNFFKNYLKVDANVNLMHQSVKNRPTTGGYYMNPLVGLYTFARGEDIKPYKEGFEVYDAGRNMKVQSWYKDITSFEQNPYWLTNRALSEDTRFRGIANLTANIKITNKLKLQLRGTADYINDKYTQRIYASTASEIAGLYFPEGESNGYANGRYIDMKQTEFLLYGDIMAMYENTWGNWSFNSAIGASINNTKVNMLRLDSKNASLYYPNQFNVANIVMNTNADIEESIDECRELQSLFGTVQVGWKDFLYVDATLRNDWSSTLAYTKNNSFMYPSIGVSWVVGNSMRLPKWISHGKLRASWGQVGNDLPLFISKLQDKIVSGGGIQANDKAPFEELKPERNTSYEIGTDWKFFNQRLGIDLTFYRSKTKNQLLTLPNAAGAAYKYSMMNAGEIRNSGIELMLEATPVIYSGFRWITGLNYSWNKNEIVSLHPELQSYIYGDEGISMNYAMRLEPGGSFGDIYGNAFQRDENGKIMLDESGLPLSAGQKNTEKVGNCTPKYMLGWDNNLMYKGFYLYFLIDARIGGEVFSATQAELDYTGVSKATGSARDKSYVVVDGQKFTDVEGFYKLVSSRNTCITEYYMYSATNVRLRELSIGYSVPKSIVDKTGIFNTVDFSLIGRNLFFFYKKAPYDPDNTMSAGNALQGVDVFGSPSYRSFGFNIKVSF